MNKKTFIFLSLIILLGAFLRFYKLDWGNGLFTHPDEYHIVGSVNQLSFPYQMHPHFFSYGTVTIYLIYFTKEVFKFLNTYNSLFVIPNSFLIGRFYSALFSTFTIFIIYKIVKILLPNSYALLSSFLVAITPGLIQQAHFTTPESNLIFFLFGSLLFLICFLQERKIKNLFFSSIFLGFALGVKISSLVFILPLVCTIFLYTYTSSRKLIKKIISTTNLIFLSLLIIIATLFIMAPFIFLDFSAFKGNLQYEGDLATGSIPVFYTRQFINTIPILFQIEKIFPYALGIPLLITGTMGFLYIFLHVMLNLIQHLIIKTSEIPKKVEDARKGVGNDKKETALLLVSFLSIFIPNAFLFAKWTRFISPTFPFFAIFSTLFIFQISKKYKRLSYLLTVFIIIITSFWTYAFFNIYQSPDVRIAASDWFITHVPENTTILVEGANMIDIPISGNYKKISLDFYNLEDDYTSRQKLIDGLNDTDYFIVQSRRVFLNHKRLPREFPKTAYFYNMLFAGKLGFEEIKEFYSYPSISLRRFSFTFPDEQAEETWSVFDHPVIRVFKKTKFLSKETYANIFEQK